MEPRSSQPRPLGSVIASARRLTAADAKRGGRGRRKVAEQAWQDEARTMYRGVGEFQFVVDTVSSKVGQARLYIGQLSAEDPSNEPGPLTDRPEIEEVLTTFGGAHGGRAQLLTRLSVNLMVTGDGWICGIPQHILDPDSHPAPPPGTPIPLLELDWRFLSIREVSIGDASVKLRLDNFSQPTEVRRDQVWLIRVWDPDPFEWWEASASSRANLPVLRELVGLTMHISAQVDSRLAGAGILVVPESAQRALKAAAGVAEDESDDFTEALIEAMLTPIADRASAAAIVPLVVTVPDEAVDKFQHITFSTPLDGEVRELRDEAIRRLALGMDAPPEVLLGSGSSNHWGCVDEETEILTLHGWRGYQEIAAGDTVLTLDHATGQAEWQELETVHRYVVTDAPMLRLASPQHQSLTTLDHRWPVVDADGNRAWLTSEELGAGDRVVTAAHGAPPTTPTHSDALVELAAWAVTSSWSRKGPRQDELMFYHPDPATADRIRVALLAEYGEGSFSQRMQRKAIAFVLRRPFARELAGAALAPGATFYDRTLSPAFLASLTQSQLELFIDAFAAADTRRGHGEGERVARVPNPAPLEAYALAGALAGYSVRWGGTKGDWYVALRSEETVPVGECGGRIETHSGIVWCPQVPNRTWLARRGGTPFFTGNSWLVSADTINSHVAPKLALICDALTTQYLWPVLAELGVEDPHQYVVWYDVGHLITRPNLSQDAMALHERKAISDEALRRATGFDEDDAPAEEDPVVSIVMAMVQSNPGMLRSPALPQMIQALRDIVAGDFAALAEQSEAPGPDVTPPQQPAAAPPAAQPEAAAEPPSEGAPRLPMGAGLPTQGTERAPVG